jgi:hypothetical protein
MSPREGTGKQHGLSLFAFLESSTNSRGVSPVSLAPENIAAASSSAPPNRLPIVSRPEASDEMRSLPARDATIVFIALQRIIVSVMNIRA